VLELLVFWSLITLYPRCSPDPICERYGAFDLQVGSALCAFASKIAVCEKNCVVTDPALGMPGRS